MNISFEPLLYGIIFVAVLMMIEGVYLLVFGKSISLNNKVNRRLDMIQKGGSREKVLEQLRKEMNQHMQSGGIPLYSMLADKAQRANIAFTPTTLIVIMAVLAVFIFMVLTQMTAASAPIRGLIAVAMGVGAVYVWVNNKCKKRLAMLEEQLPDAIELMVRSLRVGHPFSSAINIVAKEVSDPLGTEFGAGDPRAVQTVPPRESDHR